MVFYLLGLAAMIACAMSIGFIRVSQTETEIKQLLGPLKALCHCMETVVSFTEKIKTTDGVQLFIFNFIILASCAFWPITLLYLLSLFFETKEIKSTLG